MLQICSGWATDWRTEPTNWLTERVIPRAGDLWPTDQKMKNTNWYIIWPHCESIWHDLNISNGRSLSIESPWEILRVKGQLTKFESRTEASCTKYRDNYESDDPNFDLLQVAALAKFTVNTLLWLLDTNAILISVHWY